MANVNFKLLSKYRSVLMGVSILIIIMVHCGVFLCGEIGVDSFILLSGIGICYSLEHGYSKKEFYRRRIVRLLPTYFIVALPVILVTTHYSSWWKYAILCLGNFTTISQLLSLPVNYWFFFIIFLCYILAPFFYNYVKRESLKRCVLSYIYIYVIFSVLSLEFSHISIWLERIPTFFLGLCIGKYLLRNGTVVVYKRWHTILGSFVLTVLSVVLYYLSSDYPQYVMRPIYAATCPVFLLCVAYLFYVINSKYLKILFTFIGGLSFELYLVHEHIVLKVMEPYNFNVWPRTCICISVSTILAFGVSKLVKCLKFK